MGVDLWKLSLADGGEPEVFLATDIKEENAQLSPDGKWLAYESDEAGHDEVFVKPFPSGPGKWQVSVNGGEWARWSPEGDRLYFVDHNKLYQVDVETGAGLRLSSPNMVVDGEELRLRLFRGYSVAPGGQRIVTSRGVEEEDGKEATLTGLLVVENWRSDL